MLRFFARRSWDLGAVTAPWGGQPSIYRSIAAQLEAGPVLSPGELPDDERVAGVDGVRWAPGALDAMFGDPASEDGHAHAEGILRALQALTRNATDKHAATLYSLLTARAAIDYVVSLLQGIHQAQIDAERLHTCARWLATEAPDRDAVKTAISILGFTARGGNRDLLLTLGRHEEFTLYCAVALQQTEDQPDPFLWQLARDVTGWGRIQVISRLASTRDERISAWLLREGYHNVIMREYTALVCAQAGHLIEALRDAQPDPEVLTGARAILVALASGGGPAEGMEAYADGPEATERYLHHLDGRDASLADFNAVVELERFVDQQRSSNDGPQAAEWRQRDRAISEHLRSIRSRPDWHAKIHGGLESIDLAVFAAAAEAAKVFGVDTWGAYFERLERGEEEWFFVMQTDDPARVDQVLQLAEKRLPLGEIASGPADLLGLGPEFKDHHALAYILQDLRRFPGRGWQFMRAGLQSPVTRDRHMATAALGAWPRALWPAETELLLRRAFKIEPNATTRESMRKVLAGEPLES